MRLDDVADVRSGSLFDRGDATAFFVLAGDVTSRGLRLLSLSSGALPQKSGSTAALIAGDVVIALRGSTNAAAVVPPVKGLSSPIFATLDVAVVRPKNGLHAEYLAWFLNLPATQETLAVSRSGSAAPRLPLTALKALEVPLPSLERQALIACAASEAFHEDDLVRNIQQTRQRLLDELLRQAAEEGSAPGAYPTRTDHRSTGHAVTERAEPTLTIGNNGMTKSTDGRKSGTTHVVPADRGGWNVKQGGAQRASGHYETKAEAILAGRMSSRERESELKIHNLDGKIAQSDSHGHDPRNVKG